MKLNGKTIPFTDSWDVMPFYQFLKMLKLKPNDVIDLISILSDIEYEELKKAEIKGLENVLYKAEFVKQPTNFPEVPVKLGKYKLPANRKGVFDVQFESLAQFEDMRSVMVKLEETVHAHTEAYATYCALYLQKIRDGVYDADKALEMIPEVMKMPAREVVPAGSFFFTKLQTLSNGIRTNSLNTTPHRKHRIGKRTKKRSASKRH